MRIGTSSKKLDISSEKGTKRIAEKFSGYLNPGDIVCFTGEIGVGKTTFIRYLINYLQISNNEKISEIPSPTFNIVHEYEIKDIKILHYDLHRIKDSRDLINIGLLEEQNNSIILIEWPELVIKKNYKLINLKFKYEQNLKKRTLVIKSNKNKKLINDFK